MVEAFLLRGRERIAAGTRPAARDAIRDLCRAATDRARVADDLDEGHAGSALALYGEAALLYAAAAVAARTGEAIGAPLRADEVLARFRALGVDDAPMGARAEAESFLVGLSNADVLVADRLDAAGRIALCDRARRIIRWLAGLVEPRDVAEIVFVRRVRLGVLAVAGISLLVFVLTSLLSPVNVALHKPVSISASHPESVSPPSGLTDGIKSGSYGAETTVSDAPWIEVDLLGLYAVDTVKVYNRGDTAFDAGLPMTLQCSANDRDFVDLETRATAFSQTRPWIAKTHGRLCRYVRIRGARGRYVALTELEVFGRKK
jgi:F5/8 type C domain